MTIKSYLEWHGYILRSCLVYGNEEWEWKFSFHFISPNGFGDSNSCIWNDNFLFQY